MLRAELLVLVTPRFKANIPGPEARSAGPWHGSTFVTQTSVQITHHSASRTLLPYEEEEEKQREN
jgi:hypothetical protein